MLKCVLLTGCGVLLRKWETASILTFRNIHGFACFPSESCVSYVFTSIKVVQILVKMVESARNTAGHTFVRKMVKSVISAGLYGICKKSSESAFIAEIRHLCGIGSKTQE